MSQPLADPAGPSPSPPVTWHRPVFIGGTGRSGTWALGRLLRAAPRRQTIMTELRFHAEPAGLAGLIRGTVTAEKFLRDLRRHWYARHGGTGAPKGLQVVIDPPEYERAVDRFATALDAGRPLEPAAATLVLDLVGPYLAARDAELWAETTPFNAASADALVRVFPEARFLHSVRDGRDVAASVASMAWGPDDIESALAWWEARLRLADAGISGCPASTTHLVRLEELVITDRERQFARLVAFLAPDDEDHDAWRAHFDRRMTPDAAHVGRWRAELPRRRTRRLDRAYRHAYRRLAADGVTSLPIDPDTADELARR